MRPLTDTPGASPRVFQRVPKQAVGTKIPARPLGGEAEGGAYVHTDRNISDPPATFWEQFEDSASARDLDRERNRRRFRILAQVAFALKEGGEDEAAMRLLGCGRWFQRISFPCGTYKLVPYPCDSMFCPQCANRRSKALQERILKRLDQSRFDYFFLTLTVKSWEVLDREGIDRLLGMFRRFRASDDWRDAGVTGGVYSVESTYTCAGWHPHLHVLFEVRKGSLSLDFLARFKKRWRAITGDSHVLHLEKMHGINEKGWPVRTIDARSLRELVKYATKAANFSEQPDHVLAFFHAFKNVRRVQAFGNFLGALKEAEQSEKKSESNEFVGCRCAQCKWSDGRPTGTYHLFQTDLDAQGNRQLRLWEFDVGPPRLPIIEESKQEMPTKNLNLFWSQAEFSYAAA